MARKSKGTEGKTGDGVLDLMHTGVTRLDIPSAGLTVPMVVWRKVKTHKSFLALQIEGNI